MWGIQFIARMIIYSPRPVKDLECEQLRSYYRLVHTT